jgi:DNA-binding XRE family transcriptional regulator
VERGLSNREIQSLSNNKIYGSHVSLICSGKVDPNIETKCILAELFNVSVADIFPDDYLFNNIYNYNDYINLNKKAKNRLKEYRQSNNINIITLSKSLDIKYNTLYDFITKDRFNLNHDNLLKVNNFLKGELL